VREASKYGPGQVAFMKIRLRPDFARPVRWPENRTDTGAESATLRPLLSNNRQSRRRRRAPASASRSSHSEGWLGR